MVKLLIFNTFKTQKCNWFIFFSKGFLLTEISGYHLFKSNNLKTENLIYECSFDYNRNCNLNYTEQFADNNQKFEFRLKSLENVGDYYVTDYSSICMNFMI